MRVNALRFAWPRQAAACLEIPDLAIHSGERIFIHGQSGSGKSTLLALLGGVLTPQSGSVQVLGTDLTGLRHPAATAFAAITSDSFFSSSIWCRIYRCSTT